MTTTPTHRELAPDVRERLEDAAIKRLLPMRLERGGACACVKEYAGEFERLQEDAAADDIKRAVGGRVPALLVAAGAGRYESLSVTRRREIGTLEFEVMVVAASLRSREARQRGGDGVYAVMRDVRDLLHGIELEVEGCSAPKLLTEEPMLHSTDLCVWKMTFTAQHYVKNEQQPEGGPITSLRSDGYLHEISGAGDALAAGGGSVVLTDAAGGFLRLLIGSQMYIAGATSAGNNGGPFPITAVSDDGLTITFANAGGVTEAFGGTWTVKHPTPVVSGIHTL